MMDKWLTDWDKLHDWLTEWDFRIAAAKKHANNMELPESERRGLAADYRIFNSHLQKIRKAIVENDIETAVLSTAEMVRDQHLRDFLRFFPEYKVEQHKQARSEGGRHAVNERHKKNLPPLPTLIELKKEYHRTCETLRKEKGKEPAPITMRIQL